MKCLECNGRGFIEYEHGLIVVGCEACNGTGGIVSDSWTRWTEELSRAVDKKVESDIARLKKMGKILDDSNSGIKSNYTDTGSGDTSQPEQPPKPKAKKKARKRTK